jgi:hypothetical protein
LVLNTKFETDGKNRKELLAYFEVLTDDQLRKIIVRENINKLPTTLRSGY